MYALFSGSNGGLRLKGEIFMDANRMKRELGGGAVFPIGAENTAYAQYFTGECYLNMLTTSGVGIGVVTFAPGTINAWHIGMPQQLAYSSQRRTDPACNGGTRLVSGGRKTGTGTGRRRRCQYSPGGQALAWRRRGLLVPASGRGGPRRRRIQ